MNRPKLRTVLATVAAIALGSTSALAADNVVVLQDPGGAYGTALRKIMYEPFEKATGIKVVTVQEARGGPRIKEQVQAGRVQWDVAFIFDQEVKLLGPCCLSTIDYSKFSDSAKQTLAEMPDNLKREKAVALQVIGVGLVYNKDKYKDKAPQSWADFWNVKEFPGKRCLPAWPRFVFEAALMADGVPKDKLYPIDTARALKKIAEIKPAVVSWWTTSAQAPQLMLDGEADMCMAYTGTLSKLASDGAPIGVVWNQAFVYFDFFAIPKDAPHYDNAMKYLSWRLDAARAAQLTSAYPVALPSPAVFRAADPKSSELWANNPANLAKAIQWDPNYWGALSPDGHTTNEDAGQEKLNDLLSR